MRRFVVGLVSAVTLGCAEPAGPGAGADAPFQVPATMFRLDTLETLVRVSIPYRLVNASGRTLYVDRCLDGADLERQTPDGGWVTAWDRIRGCGLTAPRPLAPNDSVVGVFDVDGSLQDGSLQRFDIPTDTLWHFRLRLPLYNANGTVIPQSPQTRSTTFTIAP